MTQSTTPMADNDTGTHSARMTSLFDAWSLAIGSSLAILRRLAGTTEQEFLQIGRHVQEIHQASTTLLRTANHLVAAASGERLHDLIDRLRRIVHEIEAYLEQTQSQRGDQSTVFATVGGLLQQVGSPLEGFKKMSKRLYILEVLIKIESADSGESVGEFNNLAQDIRTLSLQIKEKANNIYDQRELLAALIGRSNAEIQIAGSAQESRIRTSLTSATASIAHLEMVNERFSRLGGVVSTVAEENANSVSEVVQSMQSHDMFRQQVEHVLEGLEQTTALLDASTSGNTAAGDAPALREHIVKMGDVCELQEAQLHFASTELHAAVTGIVTNLDAIAGKQRRLTETLHGDSGMSAASGRSFIDDVRRHMASITELLTVGVETNNQVAEIMRSITATVAAISTFVADIEEIGQDVILIALNARIKATGTGQEGASLGVLAQEIGQLAKEDSHRTQSITAALKEMHTATVGLATVADHNEAHLSATLGGMQAELDTILATLGAMGQDLSSLLAQAQRQANDLVHDIERLTASIDIHQRTKDLAHEVLNELRQIVAQSRALFPASEEFKEELRQMAERYTMDSERRIHEAISRKHGLETVATERTPHQPALEDASEFGDNVDLF